MYLDVDITYNGTSIKNKVISYDRSQSICSGIGTLTLTVEGKTKTDYQPWGTVILYEDSRKKATYYVEKVERNAVSGELLIDCKDGSKKLTDYWIAETYEIDYASYTRYWIEKFLTEAGVNYSFTTTSDGNLLSNNTSLGLSSVYDIVQNLLQQSGWYMYFNPNDVCVIGALTVDLPSVSSVYRDQDIISLEYKRHDRMLRNRAVVWGNQNPLENRWVFADVTKKTPWDTSPDDKRAVVMANGMIRNNSTAYSLAKKIVDEFARLNKEKIFEIHSARDVSIGDVVRIRSKYWSGEGLVTTCGSRLSREGGLVTKITLDERCPRLFGYYGYLDYVYVGTNGSGVWRKPLDSGLWESFSSGLDHFIVRDLIIKDGVFACCAGEPGAFTYNGVQSFVSYCYVNIGSDYADWKKYNILYLTDLDNISHSAIEAVACDIDPDSHHIYIGYRTSDFAAEALGYHRSWIVEITPELEQVSVKQIYTKDETTQDFRLIDVQKHGADVIPTVSGPAEYFQDFWGTRDVAMGHLPDGKAKTFGPLPQDDPYTDSFEYTGEITGGKCHYNIEGDTIIAINRNTLQYYSYDDDKNKYTFSKSITSLVGDVIGYPAIREIDAILYRRSERDSDGKLLENSERQYDAIFVTLGDNTRFIYHFSISPILEDLLLVQKTNAAVATTEDIILYGLQTVDGVPLVNGMRVLVKDQEDQSENGIYIVSPTHWARAIDANTAAELVAGVIINVSYGTTNAHTTWELSESCTTLNVSPIVFEQVLDIQLVNTVEYLAGSYYWIEETTPAASYNGFVYKWYGYRTLISGLMENVYLYAFAYDIINRTLTTNLLLNEIKNNSGPYIRDINAGTGMMATNLIRSGYGFSLATFAYSTHYTDSVNGGDTYATLYIFNLDGKSATTFSKKFEVDKDALAVGDPFYIPWSSSVYGLAITQYGVGYDVQGKYATAYLKYRVCIEKTDYQQRCTYCGCGAPCWPQYSDREDRIFYGCYRIPDNEPTYEYTNKRGYLLNIISTCMHGSLVGYECGSHTLFDEWTADDYDEYGRDYGRMFPISSSIIPARYVYNRTIGLGVYQSDLFSPLDPHNSIGTLEHNVQPTYGGLCMHTDDLLSLIYIYEPATSTLWAEQPTGGTVNELQGLNAGPIDNTERIIFTNGYFITCGASFGQCPTELYFFRIDTDLLFQGVDLCYLLDDPNEEGAGTFAFLDFDFYEFNTENSNGLPFVSWTNSRGLVSYTLDGVTYQLNSFYPEHFKVFAENFDDLTMLSGEYSDERNFDIASYALVAADGEVVDYGAYLLLANRSADVHYMLADNIDVDGIETFTTLASGISHKVETSNFYNSPYFFFSSSGEPSQFFQRNPGYYTWNNYSSGLPSSNVLVIRLDDRL